jgi:pyruvate dehydrogenase E2 component (dihydrolipoamide acetyltransferase)
MKPPASPSTPNATPSALVEKLETMGYPAGRYRLAPLSGVRKVVAQRLTEAARDIPHYTLSAHIDAGPLLAARAAYNARNESRASINDYVVAAAARALLAVPQLNVSFTPDGIVHHHHADIAIAVAIEGGLITPILRGVETRTLAEIGAVSRDMAQRAQNRRLKPDEYNGGTFCVSNLGMFGVSSFTSILNPPQAAILSVGAVESRAMPIGGVVEILEMMSVNLTCDHRVIDGAVGGRWLQAFRAAVENAAAIE